MEPIFQQDFQVQDMCVDRYGRLKPSTLLYFAQEIAGRHCDELADTLESHRLFWAHPAPGADQPAPGTGRDRPH